jgi:hypothetical protein
MSNAPGQISAGSIYVFAMTNERPVKPPSKTALMRDYARGHLVGRLFGKYSRSWGRDEKIVDAISNAHNSGAINVLSVVSDEALAAVQKHDFFSGQNLYCEIIPRLQADAEEMVNAVDCLIRAAGNDMAAGLPGNALARWCEADPAHSAEVLRLVNAGHAAARKFVPLALGNATAEVRSELLDHLHASANDQTDPLRCNAIFGLGQVVPSNDSEWSALLKTLQAGAESADDLVQAASLAAAAMRLRASAGIHGGDVERVIESAIKPPNGERLLHQCADSLWLDGEHFSEDLQEKMLEAMLAVDPKNIGTINQLDRALANIVRHGKAAQVATFLAQLLPGHRAAIKLKQFVSTAQAVREQPPADLHDWIVSWLLDGRFELCRHLAAGLFEGQIHERALEIDFSTFGLKPDDFAYLARKAIGYLFLQPLTVASIIASLARSAPLEKQQQLEDLLFDPMLLNYGGFAKDFLEPLSKRKDDRARKMAQNALGRIKTYLADLNAAHDITELRPSERQRQMEWQRHSDMMAEAYRLADQKSVLADLFTRVVVLYGNRSISYIRHPKQETRRIESQMHPHGVSMEVPRIEFVDPVGLQKMFLSFRSERRPA